MLSNLSETLINIKSFCITLFAGIVIGVVGTSMFVYHFSKPVEDNSKEQIVTKQISGAPISNSNYSFKGRTITFDTHADGQGEAQTTIPKDKIPEVYNWNHKTNIIQGGIYATYNTNKLQLIYELNYFKRWESFSVGGGFIFGNQLFGVGVSGQFMF
jgi:hypothetical protein